MGTTPRAGVGCSMLSSCSCMLAGLLLLLACSSPAAAGMYFPKSGITELSSADFDAKVTKSLHKNVWMVEFYAPWCGHCQKLKSDYEKMAKTVKGMVKVGAVDASEDKNKPLAGRFGVQGFLTSKVFDSENPNGADYQGQRTGKAMAEHVLS